MDSSEQRHVEALHNWWRPVEIKLIQPIKSPRDSEHHLFKLRNRLDGYHTPRGHEPHDGYSTYNRLFMKGLAHGRVVKPHHLHQHGHHHQHVESQPVHCTENAHDKKRKAAARDIGEIVNEQREKHRIRMLEQFWDGESERVHYHNGMYFTMPSVKSHQEQEAHAHEDHGHEWQSSVTTDAAAAPREPEEVATGLGRRPHHTRDSKRKDQGSASSLWLEHMMRRWVE